MNWIDFWFFCVDLILCKEGYMAQLLTKQQELNQCEQLAEGISAGLYSDSE